MSIDSKTAKVVIAVEKFPDGYMEAMTMSYGLSDLRLLNNVKAGDKVDFTISKDRNGMIITMIQKLPAK
jgi:Cu/Ag efflux protein CusF